MLVQCPECKEMYDKDELELVQTTYEAYYGVSSEFSNSTPLVLIRCPYCGEDINADDVDVSEDAIKSLNDSYLYEKKRASRFKGLCKDLLSKALDNDNLKQIEASENYDAYSNNFTLDKSKLFTKGSYATYKNLKKEGEK